MGGGQMIFPKNGLSVDAIDDFWGECRSYLNLFFKKKYFLHKYILLKVIPSYLPQVGEAAMIFCLNFLVI